MGENLPLSYFKSGKDGFLPFCSMDLMVGNVVCKQMGFDGALSSDINVGVNNWTSCWSLRDVKCSGSEDRLSDCYGCKYFHVGLHYFFIIAL